MRKRNSCRRGQADLIALVAVIFIFAIVLLIANEVLGAVSASANASGIAMNQSYGIVPAQNAMTTFDYLFLFLIFGLGLASILSAFYIRSHPAFFIVSFFITLIIILVSTLFSNIYFSIASDASLTASASTFPLTLLVFQYLPAIMLGLSVAVAVVTYAKSSSNISGY